MRQIKKNFSFFNKNKGFVYLDSAATNLKPKKVIAAITDYYNNFSINNHTEINNSLYRKISHTIKNTRKIIAEKINGIDGEVVFFPSSTYAFNILAFSLSDLLQKNDEVLICPLEHSSNLFPWQSLSLSKKCKLNFFKLKDDYSIEYEDLSSLVNERTKVVSFSHLYNSLGVINPVKEIISSIKKYNPDSIIIVDICQSIAHIPINLSEWNVDIAVFSGHKVFGPTGIGVAWINSKIKNKLKDVIWGGGKNYGPLEKKKHNLLLKNKFEVGTLPIAQIFGLEKSFEFISDPLFFNQIKEREEKLYQVAIKELKKIRNITIYSNCENPTNIITFNLENFHSHDVADCLGKNNIYVRSGNFCCPLFKEVTGVDSAVRISISVYNTENDIYKLIRNLKKIQKDSKLLIPW